MCHLPLSSRREYLISQFHFQYLILLVTVAI